eukprot:scaffold81106_cov54-Cyclotella_meneghiniana.AAC.1
MANVPKGAESANSFAMGGMMKKAPTIPGVAGNEVKKGMKTFGTSGSTAEVGFTGTTKLSSNKSPGIGEVSNGAESANSFGMGGMMKKSPTNPGMTGDATKKGMKSFGNSGFVGSKQSAGIGGVMVKGVGAPSSPTTSATLEGSSTAKSSFGQSPGINGGMMKSVGSTGSSLKSGFPPMKGTEPLPSSSPATSFGLGGMKKRDFDNGKKGNFASADDFGSGGDLADGFGAAGSPKLSSLKGAKSSEMKKGPMDTMSPGGFKPPGGMSFETTPNSNTRGPVTNPIRKNSSGLNGNNKVSTSTENNSGFGFGMKKAVASSSDSSFGFGGMKKSSPFAQDSRNTNLKGSEQGGPPKFGMKSSPTQKFGQANLGSGPMMAEPNLPLAQGKGSFGMNTKSPPLNMDGSMINTPKESISPGNKSSFGFGGMKTTYPPGGVSDGMNSNYPPKSKGSEQGRPQGFGMKSASNNIMPPSKGSFNMSQSKNSSPMRASEVSTMLSSLKDEDPQNMQSQSANFRGPPNRM